MPSRSEKKHGGAVDVYWLGMDSHVDSDSGVVAASGYLTVWLLWIGKG